VAIRFFATVEAIAPGIDLALLKLDDESYFLRIRPLARASMLPDVKGCRYDLWLSYRRNEFVNYQKGLFPG